MGLLTKADQDADADQEVQSVLTVKNQREVTEEQSVIVVVTIALVLNQEDQSAVQETKQFKTLISFKLIL